MEDVKIMYAIQKHKEFIIRANKIINHVNETDGTNYLEKNIDHDLFGEKPLFKCIIAEINNKPVGLVLYSYFYWANDGEVLWISQMYIEEEYRKSGVFFKLINYLKEENKNIHIISCATGNENQRMNKILKGYGAKEIDLTFYYKKVD